MPPAIILAPVQPTYGDGCVGAALSHMQLTMSRPGRLGDRSVSAIHHCTSEAASPLSSPHGHSSAIQRTAAVDPERSYSRRVSASVNVRSGTHSLVGWALAGRAMPLPSWQASRCIRTQRQSSGPPQRRIDCFVSSRLAMPRVVRAERPPGQDRHFRRQPLRRTKRASRRCRRRSFPPPFPRS